MKIVDTSPRSERFINLRACNSTGDPIENAQAFIREDTSDEVTVHFIKSEIKGRGVATLLLIEILEWAEKNGAVVAFGDLLHGQGLDQRREWAKKRGFTLHHDGHTVYGSVGYLISRNKR